MGNPVNEWIRGGSTPAAKDKRRYIIAGICAAAGVACALLLTPIAGPEIAYGTGLVLLAVAVVKVKNAATDDT